MHWCVGFLSRAKPTNRALFCATRSSIEMLWYILSVAENQFMFDSAPPTQNVCVCNALLHIFIVQKNHRNR